MSRRVLAVLASVAALVIALVSLAGLTSAAATDTAPTAAASEPTTSATTASTPATTTATAATTTASTESTTATASATATATESNDPITAFAVSDAVFRWGVNDESNNRNFAPGTYNFLSAGTAPNPGRGEQVLDGSGRWPSGATAWRASEGNVRIEKITASGAQPATYAGLRTGPSGEAIPSPTSGIFSHHQVVITGGTGQVDPAAATASISWRGSFTVFFYSGMSFFTVADPTLEVTPTSSKVTATLSGYGSSRDDLSTWVPLAAQRVTLADLNRITSTELGAAKGFTAPTRYAGVTYAAGPGGSPQVRTGNDWGAAPTSMLGYLEKVGTAAFWYSTGGSTDRFKATHPITVSWDAKTPITPEPPAVTPPPKQPKNPPGKTPPPAKQTTPAPTQPAGPAIPQPLGPALPVQAPGVVGSVPAPDAALPRAHQPLVYLSARPSPHQPDRSATPDRAWEWALGALLLLTAAGMSVAHPVINRMKGNR